MKKEKSQTAKFSTNPNGKLFTTIQYIIKARGGIIIKGGIASFPVAYHIWHGGVPYMIQRTRE